MVQAYKKFWLGAFTFNKKTSRKDFWSALLTHIIIFVILFKAYHFFNLLDFYQLATLWQTFASFFQLVFNLYFFGSLLSFIALTVRRLNDADLPWALIFLNFILGLGTLVLLVLNLLPSSPRALKFEEYKINSSQEFNNLPETKTLSGIFKDYFKNYFEFRGRTTRRNFWWMQLFWGLTFILFLFLIYLFNQFEQIMFGYNFIGSMVLRLLFFLFILGTFFPQLTIHVRRLRDAGLSNLGLSLLLGGTSGILIFYQMFTKTLKITYTTGHYQLVQYLLFLLVMIAVLSLILVEVMATGELKTNKKNSLFEKID